MKDKQICQEFLGLQLVAYLCDFKDTKSVNDGSTITQCASDRLYTAARAIEVLRLRYDSPANIQAWFRGNNSIIGGQPLKLLHEGVDYETIVWAATQHVHC